MKKILLGLLCSSVLFVGCDRYLDVNTDPNSPADVSMKLLLPETEVWTAEIFSTDNGIGFDMGVYAHQLSTREEADAYQVDGNEGYSDNLWYYGYVYTLQNIKKLIQKAEEQKAPVYSGIGKILKAYIYSELVDIYADVPFTEANMTEEGNPYPVFDKGETIYPVVLALLDEAIADLQKPAGGLVPTSDDLIYGGSAAKWIKVANTIKLKLYNQIRLVDSSVGTKINALLAGNQLISSTADGFMFYYGTKSTPEERNPMFYTIYEATQKSFHISPWFFEILKGINPVFSGIADPRMPYYIYNQLGPKTANREGNQCEYRVGGFVSIYFGSKGPDRDKSQDKSISVPGIYPCGGRYDSGDATQVSGTSGTGAAPLRFLTYADRLYIEAELIQAGVITGDAKGKLTAAMNESFKQVDYVVGKVAPTSQTVPTLYNTTEANDYIGKIIALYDAGDANKKMEIIMTQKWIAGFGGNAADQYTDYRRTGYPILFDPNLPSLGGYITPPAGGDPSRTLPPVKISCSLNFPKSIPWPNSDLNVNPNAPAQKADPSNFPVFWDK